MSGDLPNHGDPDDRSTLDHPSGAMDGTTVVGGGTLGLLWEGSDLEDS